MYRYKGMSRYIPGETERLERYERDLERWEVELGVKDQRLDAEEIKIKRREEMLKMDQDALERQRTEFAAWRERELADIRRMKSDAQTALENAKQAEMDSQIAWEDVKRAETTAKTRESKVWESLETWKNELAAREYELKRQERHWRHHAANNGNESSAPRSSSSSSGSSSDGIEKKRGWKKVIGLRTRIEACTTCGGLRAAF